MVSLLVILMQIGDQLVQEESGVEGAPHNTLCTPQWAMNAKQRE